MTEVDFLEVAEFNLGRAASIEAGKQSINFPRLLAILGAGVKVQELRLNPAPAETKPATAEAPTHYGFSAPEEPTLRYGFKVPVETKSGGAETAEPTETKTAGDAAADKIIAAFEGEQYLADSDLLKASGLKRSEYIQVRDYLLYDTCELIEMEAEEDGVTVYAYAKPRKQAAA